MDQIGDVAGHLHVLGDVVAAGPTVAGGVLHALRDRVGDEHHASGLQRGRWYLREGVHDGMGIGRREAGSLVERGQHVDRHVGDTSLGQGAGGVLTILAAPGVAGERRRGNHEDAAGTLVAQLTKHVGQEWGAVPVAQHQRYGRSGLGDCLAQRVDELVGRRVDRTHPVHPVVVLCHRLQPCRGDPSTGDVLQEGHHLVIVVWPTERGHDHGVVGVQRIVRRDRRGGCAGRGGLRSAGG